jgi:hypothetical protein
VVNDPLAAHRSHSFRKIAWMEHPNVKTRVTDVHDDLETQRMQPGKSGGSRESDRQSGLQRTPTIGRWVVPLHRNASKTADETKEVLA